MANVKISALPSTTATTHDDWVIKNDSGETTTSKAQLKYVLGMTSLNGNNAVQSSSWLTSLGTTASTESSIAIGNGAEATSPYAIAIGYRALNTNRDGARDKYIAIGYEAQSITEGVAIGADARCLATAGFAIGNSTRVFGNGGFALGGNAESYGNDGVAIGKNAVDGTGLVGANYGVAVGPETDVNHEKAVSLGYGVQSVYSATTHVTNLDVVGQVSNTVQSLGSGDTFSINWELGQSVEMTLTGNSTCSMTGIRDGARYRVKLTTTGTQTLTPSASGYTFIYEGGGFSLTNNGTDLCVLDVFGTTIMVSHIANFS